MDFPISVPSVGLVGGKFVDEDPLAGTPGSLIPAQWGNAVTEEILKVITDAGLVPAEENNTQLSQAIKAIVAGGRLIKSSLITASGVFTPDPRSTLFFIEWVAGGGGSGVLPATAAGQTGCVGGGAYGSYGCGWFTAAQIGASQPVTVGLGGAGGNVSLGNGQSGGATSMGGLFSAPGGNGSPAGVVVATSSNNVALGGTSGGVGSGGSELNLAGEQGDYGIAIFSNTLGGKGGSGPFGVGGQASGGTFIPTSGTGYGAGAGGQSSAPSSALKNGIVGRPGVIRVREYA